MKPVSRKELITALELVPEDLEAGEVSLSKGKFTLRQGFFYRTSEAEKVFAPLLEKLTAAGFVLSEVEHGEKWAAFVGGAPLKKQSFYWVSFKAARKVEEA